MHMKTKEHLIAELEQARAVTRALLRDLETASPEQREVYPTWTIKEFLAHITGWDDACIATLQAVSRGEPGDTPAAGGFDPFNAANVSRRMALSLDEVIQELERTRAVFLQAIRDLPDERAGEAFVSPWGPIIHLPEMVQVFAEHEIEHVEEIRARLSGHAAE